MRYIKTATIYLLLLYSITSAVSVRVNFPFPLITATAHDGQGISDKGTSYFGINVIFTNENIYSELNFQFLTPILWTEGKWSELETDKQGEYLTASLQHILTEGNKLFNLYIGPSVFGYNFNTNNITDTYVGAGVTTTASFTKEEDNDKSSTLLLSLSSTTDFNHIFINPRLSYISYEMSPDLEGIHLNILMSIGINYSKNYTYYDTGIALGFIF